MLRKYSIRFFPVDAAITKPVTKFGGQPVWIGEPRWPLNPATRDPLRFIGQVSLELDVFSDLPYRMAYLFAGDFRATPQSVWSLDDVAAAVVLDPGEFAGPLKDRAIGPTIHQIGTRPGEERPSEMPCEYRVESVPGEDPEPPDTLEWEEREDVETVPFSPVDLGSKLGGVPGFLTKAEIPFDGDARLLLQLELARVPFQSNVDGAKMAYVFLSGDGKRTRVLWQ